MSDPRYLNQANMHDLSLLTTTTTTIIIILIMLKITTTTIEYDKLVEPSCLDLA